MKADLYVLHLVMKGGCAVFEVPESSCEMTVNST